MPKHIPALLLIATVLVSISVPGTSSAAGGWHQQLARRGGESGVSLNEAVRRAQHDTGGRVLSADTVNQGGRMVHRIKVLTPSGQVRVVVIDAQSRGR